MSYGVVRVQKFTAGSVKGIEIHDNREKDHSNTNPDIDFERSGENFSLGGRMVGVEVSHVTGNAHI